MLLPAGALSLVVGTVVLAAVLAVVVGVDDVVLVDVAVIALAVVVDPVVEITDVLLVDSGVTDVTAVWFIFVVELGL